MSTPDFEEMLATAQAKLRRGESFRAILAYLQLQQAIKEQVKAIMNQLRKEEKALKAVVEAQPRKPIHMGHLRKGIVQLAGGLLLMTIGWFYYSQGDREGLIFLLPVAGGVIGGFVVFSGIVNLIAAFVKR